MQYYKVVNPLLLTSLIDTRAINYSSTLESWDQYSGLLALVTDSSTALDLPLDFYLTLHNQLAIHGNFYLDSIRRSSKGNSLKCFH